MVDDDMKLTEQEKRIKLAEADGWDESPSGKWSNNGFILPDPLNPPDYFNDLNAVHELEKMLLPDDAYYSQRNFYSSEVGRVTGNDNGQGWKPLSNDACFNILHATAAQRAEAIGKTLNLW
jgi:hypothetical protein